MIVCACQDLYVRSVCAHIQTAHTIRTYKYTIPVFLPCGRPTMLADILNSKGGVRQ
jgi:hypothetical protein